MRISKKMAAIFLAVVMVVSAIPFTASAVTFRTAGSPNCNSTIDAASLNVGDYIYGTYEINFSGRTLVAESGPYNMYVNGANVTEDTSVTLDSNYYIQNGSLKNDVTNTTIFFQGFYVTSIDNGVVTFGISMPGSGGSGAPAQNAAIGYAGYPYSQYDMDHGVSADPFGGMGGFGNPSIPGFGDEEDEEELVTPDVEAYRIDANGDMWYYTYLEDAVADSIEGETIVLYKNVDLSGKYARSQVSYIFNLKNRTLDLNGKKLSMYNHAVGFSGDNMTIKNGTFECTPAKTDDKLSYALPIYPEIFERQSTTSGDLNTVSDKSTGVVLEDLTLNPGGLNVKGAEVTCKNLNVTGHSYYGVSAEFDSVVTIESGSYTTTNGGRNVILTSDMTDGHPSIVDNTQYIIKGGTFTLGSASSMFKATTKDHYTVTGGTFQNSSNAPVDVSNYYDTEIFSQDSNGTVVQNAPINGASITVEDTITENFYIDEEYYKAQNNGNDVYVTANYNHNSDLTETPDFQTETKDLSTLDALDKASSPYDGARILSVLQAPAQSTEPITVKVYGSEADALAGTNPIDTIEYSVYNYCVAARDAAIANNDTELQALVESTLDYAAAAQIYFGYNTGVMATKDNSGDAFYNNVAGANLSGVEGFTALPACVTDATMVVKSRLEIKFISETPIEATNISHSGISYRNETNNGYYVIRITGIDPDEMNDVFTISTTEGNITCSANTVMKVFANSGKANLATLAKAMFLYGQAADAYFE